MLFGRNPNRPYDVRQLFGGAGSQLDRPKHWDSYEMESQKFLQIGEWWKLNTKFCYCFWRENQASQTNLLIVHTTRSQKWRLSSTISWFLNFIAKTEMVMDYVYQFWIFFSRPYFLIKGSTFVMKRIFDPYVLWPFDKRIYYYLPQWPQPIWIKVRTSWQIPPQHQITYLGGPDSASIEIPLSDLT